MASPSTTADFSRALVRAASFAPISCARTVVIASGPGPAAALPEMLGGSAAGYAVGFLVGTATLLGAGLAAGPLLAAARPTRAQAFPQGLRRL